jgi:hypothetical protein
MSTSVNYPTKQKNPWIARARKFLIIACTAIVQIGADNLWQDAPTWFYPLVTTAGAVLAYLVPNAPKYKNSSIS